MSNSKFPLRNFIVPSGYSLPVIKSDIFNNVTINALYTYFALCYGQMITTYVQTQKKGKLCNMPSKAKYLLMSLYVLRNWYNGGFSFTSNLAFGAGYTSNFYWEQTITGTDTTQPLVINVAHGNNIGDFIKNLNLALPVGFTASLTNSGTTVYISTVDATTQYLMATTSLNGNQIHQDTEQSDQWPCLSYKAVQQIIEVCIKICGEVNCQTLAALETDNVYTPVGIMKALPIPGITNYQPDIYFN